MTETEPRDMIPVLIRSRLYSPGGFDSGEISNGSQTTRFASQNKTNGSPGVYMADNRLIPLEGPIIDLRDEMQLPDQPIRTAKQVYENLIARMVYNYKDGLRWMPLEQINIRTFLKKCK